MFSCFKNMNFRISGNRRSQSSCSLISSFIEAFWQSASARRRNKAPWQDCLGRPPLRASGATGGQAASRLVPRSPRKRAKEGTPGSKYAGGHRIRVTPVPIPNTEVKPDTADGTARGTVWESRSLPAVIAQKARSHARSGLFSFRDHSVLKPIRLEPRFPFNQTTRHPAHEPGSRPNRPGTSPAIPGRLTTRAHGP